MNENSLLSVGEAIDQLVNIDVSGRGIIKKLYSFAREKTDRPLVLNAAEQLVERIKKKGTIFISTGWIHRPWVSEHIAESDGPPGAALLARALHKAFGIAPIILVEPNIIEPMKKVLQAAGFVILTPNEAIKALEGTSLRGGLLKVASVIGFPIDDEDAKRESISLVEKYKPDAVIVIEKGGMNEAGKVHSSRGDDTSYTMAKIDYLVLYAKQKKILTIGIGDGGNEVGMGLIRERLKENFALAKKCNCPCEKGIAPQTETDCLITANVSNWGAYALEACLAILKQDNEILHTPDMEIRVLARAADAQFADGISGYVEPSVDGMLAEVHKSLIIMLAEVVKRGIPEIYGQSRFAR